MLKPAVRLRIRSCGRPNAVKATAGVFQATRGDVLIDFPFTEHATVFKGEVTLTDATGQTVRLLPGDSYLIKQDSLIFWQVARNFVQKSFFNVVEE